MHVFSRNSSRDTLYNVHMSFASPISLFRFPSSSIIYHVLSTYLAQSKKYMKYSWWRRSRSRLPFPPCQQDLDGPGESHQTARASCPPCPPSHHKCQFTVRQSLTRSGKSPKLGHIFSSLTVERIQGELFNSGRSEQVCLYFLLRYNQEYYIFPVNSYVFWIRSLSKDTRLSPDRQLPINWVFNIHISGCSFDLEWNKKQIYSVGTCF